MKAKIKLSFNLIFFILITNTYHLQSHDYFNGGCKNHCNESVKSIFIEKKLNNINDKEKIDENYSCLRKSLCRG